MSPGWLLPDWPAPSNIRALVTTRHGGVSNGPYASMNLGAHVGDAPFAVAQNRAVLRRCLPAEPLWLDQVHGAGVVDAARARAGAQADAAVAFAPGIVCAVMTADCLPVLLCDDEGQRVAAAHAGWRGLAAGILGATIGRMGVSPARLIAWLGPAIGPQAFEVGEEVREAFRQAVPLAEDAFKPAGEAGKWFGDLFMLARLDLQMRGVGRVFGGGECTYSDPARYFSYRRDRITGRFATLVWRAA